jgi:hypothetical protein
MADGGDAIGALLGLFLLLAAIAVVLFIAYFLLMAAIAAGGLYGAYVSLRNYARAFASNVKPERIAVIS